MKSMYKMRITVTYDDETIEDITLEFDDFIEAWRVLGSAKKHAYDYGYTRRRAAFPTGG